jgi:hypothetical protein
MFPSPRITRLPTEVEDLITLTLNAEENNPRSPAYGGCAVESDEGAERRILSGCHGCGEVRSNVGGGRSWRKTRCETWKAAWCVGISICQFQQRGHSYGLEH